MNVRRSKPGSFDIAAAEIAEVGAGRGIAPSVDGLADEHDFARAFRDAIAHFRGDGFLRTMIETAPHVRDDAERTVVGAAALHRRKGTQPREVAGNSIAGSAEGKGQNIVAIVLGKIASVPERRPPRLQPVGQLYELARTEDGVDVGREPLHPVTVLFGQTAHDDQAHCRIGVLEDFKMIHSTVGAPLGVVADGARIEQYDVGRLW